MSRPGVDVGILETPGSVVSQPIDTGTAFWTGLTERGALGAHPVYSLDDFVTKYGQRVSYGTLYDSAQAFFREGGNKVYISRVVGPTPTSGFKNLPDAGAVTSLVATAVGPGDWSGTIKVAVLTGTVGGTFIIQVTDASNNVLEDSGNLEDQNSAILWSQSSGYIRLTLGASANDPAVLAPVVLSTGTDDRNNITDTQWANALAMFTTDLGPGQVSAPGRTTTTAHQQLIAHVEANDRVALLDLTDSNSVATLSSNADNSRFAAAFAPWVQVPGLVAGSVRVIPASAVIAGMIARNDPGLGTNHPAAGRFGASNYAIGVSQNPFTDAQRDQLNNAGVNVIRVLAGTVTNYGWRSTTDPTSDSNWIDFGNARLFMKLTAELNQVGQNWLFEEIDGQNGRTIGGFHDSLVSVLLRHYNMGELFGDTADAAFQVDTGTSVNTLETIANMELHAICYVKMSPFAEYVEIRIVKRAVQEV